MRKFDPEKIPVWLRRTPEQQQADQALQDRLRQAQGPGRRPDTTERRLIHAAAVKRSAEAQLHNLQFETAPDPLHVSAAKGQLAEALALEGRYAEAAALHPSAAHAEQFSKIAAAIDRNDDDPRCNCPIQRLADPATGDPVTLTSETIAEMVFSPKHGKLMPLVKCVDCGDLNVKPAPSHLQERMDRVRQQHRDERAKRGGIREARK